MEVMRKCIGYSTLSLECMSVDEPLDGNALARAAMAQSVLSDS